MTEASIKRPMATVHPYQALFDFLPDGYLETDPTGIIQRANRAAASLFRVKQDSLVGQSLLDFVAGELAEPQSFQNQLTQLTHLERLQDWEVMLQTEDGAPFLTSLTAGTVREAGGQLMGLRWLLRDITERRRADETFQSKLQELNLAYRQAIAYARDLVAEILRHRQAEAALRASEERYRSLVEASPDGIVLADLNATITLVNQQTARLLGYERIEEIIGKSGFDFIAPEDWPQATEYLRQTFETGSVRDAQYTLVKKDGTRFPGELSATLIRDAQGMPQAITGVLRDITRRREAETLRDAMLLLTSGLDLGPVLEKILVQLEQVITFDSVCIFLLDKDSLYAIAGRGFPDLKQVIGLRRPSDSPLFQEILQTCRPLILVNAQADPRFEHWGGTEHVRGWMGIPLLVHGQVIGYLALDSRQVAAYGQAEANLAQAFANQAAIAIENARLHTQSEWRAEQLTILNKAGRTMSSFLDLGQVLEQMVVEATTLVDAEGASLLLLEPQGDELTFVASVSPASEQLIGTRMPATVGIAGQAVQAKQSFLVYNVQEDPHFYRGIDAITQLTTHSLIAVPLLVRHRVIGVIEVVNKLAGVFDQSDRDVLEALCGSAAVAIENARLFETTRHSQERYHHLFDDSPIPLWEEDYSEVKRYLDRLQAAGVEDLDAYFQQHPGELKNCARMVKVIEVNRAGVAFYQARDKEELLTGLGLIFTRERDAAFRRQLVVMAAGQTAYDCETINQTLAGNRVQVWLRLSIPPGHEDTWSKVLVSIVDITALKKAEAVVIRQRQELRRLSTQLINTQEAERKHLAHELHDQMGQTLTSIGLNLDLIAQELPPSFPPASRERLADTILLVDQTLAQVRELSLNLRPSMLDDFGLEATLSWYVKQYAARGTVEIELDTREFEGRLKTQVEIALYRVVQEALTNVARHAQARRVYLHLARQGASVTVLIEDDGQGFDVEATAKQQASEPRLGLLGIRERIAALGGRLEVQSQPGRGTRLFIEIPI